MSEEQSTDFPPPGLHSDPMFEKKPDAEPITESDGVEDIKTVARHIEQKWRDEGRTAEGESVRAVDRGWKKPDGSPVEGDKTVTLQENARELGKVYQAESEHHQQQADAELTNAIDQARLENAYQNDPAFREQYDAALAQQQQPQATEQPTQQPETPEGRLAAKWQALDPEVRTALEQQVQQIEVAQKQFAEAAHEAARVSAAAIFAQYPELAGLSSDQINGALAVLSRENPQKFLQIQSQIAQAKHYYDQSQQYRAAEQQKAQQKATSEFSQYVQQQDAIFEDAVAKEYGAEKVKQVKGAVWDIAQEAYGLSKEQLRGLWDTQPLLRTAAMQKMFFDAAAFQMAKRGVARPDPQPVPPVQRPGTYRGPSDGNEEIAALTRKVAKTGSLKDATALRLAKMRARGG